MRLLLTTAALSLMLGGAAALPAAASTGDWSDDPTSGGPLSEIEKRTTDPRRLARAVYTDADDSEETTQPRRRSRSARHERDADDGEEMTQPRRRSRSADRERPRHVASSPRQERRASPAWTRKSLSAAGPRASGSQGIASYYWQGQRVASGGRFNPNAMTAAHRTLPFGTRVRVTHIGNGRSVEVTINDRGPFIRGRIIDLSKAAAGVIGMTAQGLARVSVEVLGR
jgi:rare lipoprotein A